MLPCMLHFFQQRWADTYCVLKGFEISITVQQYPDNISDMDCKNNNHIGNGES
jgi:hypothetical protein